MISGKQGELATVSTVAHKVRIGWAGDMPAIVADHPCVGVPYHGPKLSTFRAVRASRARIRVESRATPVFVRILCHGRHFFWQLQFTLLDFQELPAILIP